MWTKGNSPSRGSRGGELLRNQSVLPESTLQENEEYRGSERVLAEHNVRKYEESDGRRMSQKE